MINNKQVNIWRGDAVPPTIYHIWIKDNSKLLLFNGTEWITFVDDIAIIDTLNQIVEKQTLLENDVSLLKNKTVNSKKIVDNPVLTGKDLKTDQSGNFVLLSDTITQTLIKFDTMFSTQIIE